MNESPASDYFASETLDCDRTPMPQRQPLVWPQGKPLAMAIVVCAEYYELNPPADAVLPRNVPGGFGRAPYPDYRAYSYREYGSRVGIFRVIDALDRAGIRGTLAVDAMTADSRKVIVDTCVARDWEVIGHGLSATRTISSRMSRDEEFAYIGQSLDSVQRSCGVRPSGWHGPEYGQSTVTPELLCQHGLEYMLDVPNDEQPYRVRTAAGEIVALPMSIDLDDVFWHWHRKVPMARWVQAVTTAADRLMDADSPSGRVLILNLHPWLIGQASRILFLEELLATLTARTGIWWATAAQIAGQYQSSPTLARSVSPD